MEPVRLSTSERAVAPSPPRPRYRVGRLVGGLYAAALAVWAAFAVFLATYNLELYPTTWFDEGSHLHVPKTLVQHGVYADLSSEGYRHFGPTTGLGPTVTLPVALAFKVAGIGLLQARAVMVAYLLAALALITEAARRLFGLPTALLASLLVLTAPGVDVLYLGRQALGEIPALAFFALGVLLWWRSLETPRGGASLALASLAFGLAALTKNQLGLMLVLTFAVTLLVDRLHHRQLRPRHSLAPLLTVVGVVGLAYLAFSLLVVGAQDAVGVLALQREASAGATLVFAPRRMLSSLKFLASPDAYAYWAAPGLLYAMVLARERSLAGLRVSLLTVFVVVGLAWYAFFSIGWPRYASAPLAVAGILVAKMLHDLLSLLWRAGDVAGNSAAGASRARAIAVLLAVVLSVAYPLQEQARAVVTASDRSPQLVAAYLDANVSPSEVIETWEPELGFLTDHRYHYPPSGWLDRSVRATWLGADHLVDGYDPIAEARPSHVVVGRFGKYTGIYSQVLANAHLRLLTSIGEYDVYEVRYR